MDNALLQRLLFVQAKAGRPADITVKGVNMHPTLFAGDVVTLVRAEDYAVGAILVFRKGC